MQRDAREDKVIGRSRAGLSVDRVEDDTSAVLISVLDPVPSGGRCLRVRIIPGGLCKVGRERHEEPGRTRVSMLFENAALSAPSSDAVNGSVVLDRAPKDSADH
jgi:hypothetical protein